MKRRPSCIPCHRGRPFIRRLLLRGHHSLSIGNQAPSADYLPPRLLRSFNPATITTQTSIPAIKQIRAPKESPKAQSNTNFPSLSSIFNDDPLTNGVATATKVANSITREFVLPSGVFFSSRIICFTSLPSADIGDRFRLPVNFDGCPFARPQRVSPRAPGGLPFQ